MSRYRRARAGGDRAGSGPDDHCLGRARAAALSERRRRAAAHEEIEVRRFVGGIDGPPRRERENRPGAVDHRRPARLGPGARRIFADARHRVTLPIEQEDVRGQVDVLVPRGAAAGADEVRGIGLEGDDTSVVRHGGVRARAVAGAAGAAAAHEHGDPGPQIVQEDIGGAVGVIRGKIGCFRDERDVAAVTADRRQITAAVCRHTVASAADDHGRAALQVAHEHLGPRQPGAATRRHPRTQRSDRLPLLRLRFRGEGEIAPIAAERRRIARASRSIRSQPGAADRSYRAGRANHRVDADCRR